MGEAPSQSVEMTIKGLILDPSSKTPIVILQREDTPTMLPIWIGLCEANAIALELEGIEAPRPMTHDLLLNLLETLGYRVPSIHIHALTDSVFYATISLIDGDGRTAEVDSRPSDALAVAVRSKARIYVANAVLDQAKVEEASEEEALKSVLERLRPEDLGEYEM